jgi:predicted anti-sigma-YlaC factor YlaD
MCEDIAAYLDGELDCAARSEVEQHLKECSPCASCLREQRRLLRTLDFALSDDPLLRLPANFPQIVAAHAQSDMSGLRRPSEHRRALRICVALFAGSLILLGGAAMSDTVLRPIIRMGSLFDLLWQLFRSVGTGISIILRAASRHFLFDSHPLGLLLALLLFISALALLPRLIISYHRQGAIREDGA